MILLRLAETSYSRKEYQMYEENEAGVSGGPTRSPSEVESSAMIVIVAIAAAALFILALVAGMV